MKKIVLGFVVAMAVSVPAHAQQLANKNYNIILNLDDINVLSEALQLEPMGKAFPVISKMRQQVLSQQPQEPPSESPKPKVEVPKSAPVAPAKAPETHEHPTKKTPTK